MAAFFATWMFHCLVPLGLLAFDAGPPCLGLLDPLNLSGTTVQTEAAAYPLLSLRRADALRRESFEKVWRTVRDKHFDPDFGGLDWNEVRRKYSARLATISDNAELYRLLQEMLGELQQSHFNILAPELALDGDGVLQPGVIGVDLKLLGGRPVITRVEPGSSAAESEITTGYVLVEIDGQPVSELIAPVQQHKGDNLLKRLKTIHLLKSRLSGPPGSRVRLRCRDGAGGERDHEIERRWSRSELSPRFVNLPPMPMEFEARRLPGGMGYIRFNVFVVPLMAEIRQAIGAMHGAPGLILDLRGNPGGIGGMSAGIAGLLVDQETSLGTMRMRRGYQRFAVFPQSGAYLGPLAILLDEESSSTSEILAAGLQEIGRATIVGRRSAGAALPSIIQRLPTGALFQYAIADLTTPGGRVIEGRGVEPDISVALTRASLLQGRDSQLEAAIEHLRTR